VHDEPNQIGDPGEELIACELIIDRSSDSLPGGWNLPDVPSYSGEPSLRDITTAHGFDYAALPSGWKKLWFKSDLRAGDKSLHAQMGKRWNVVAGSSSAMDDLGAQLGQGIESSHSPSIPRMWRLFSYILPHRTREQVFEPAYSELLDDYLTTWKEQSKWAQRWLTVAYTWRTFVMVADCLAAASRDRAFRLLAGFLPDWAQDWVRRLG
jgi:hypothetical protein